MLNKCLLDFDLETVIQTLSLASILIIKLTLHCGRIVPLHNPKFVTSVLRNYLLVFREDGTRPTVTFGVRAASKDDKWKTKEKDSLFQRKDEKNAMQYKLRERQQEGRNKTKLILTRFSVPVFSTTFLGFCNRCLKQQHNKVKHKMYKQLPSKL